MVKDRRKDCGGPDFRFLWRWAGPIVVLSFFLILPGDLRSQSFSVLASNSLFSAPDTASFGLTRTTVCDTLQLPVVNKSADPIILDSLRFLGKVSSFALAYGLSGVVISPGEKVGVGITYCPTDTSCESIRLAVYVRSMGTEGEAVVHTIGIGGCGGTPFVEAGKDSILFGPVPIPECREEAVTLMNTGNFPLRVTAITRSNSAFRILDPLQFPFTIPPYSSREIRLEFCPPKVGTILDSLRIVADVDNAIPAVYLLGTGGARELRTPSSFDFGSVPLGKCVDTFLVVENVGTLPTAVTSVSLADLLFPEGFTLTSYFPPDQTRTLFPGDTLQVHVRFCPPAEGEGENSLRITDESGAVYLVAISGRGRLPFAGLDTTDAEAGEIATLTFRIGPGDVVGSGPYRIRLSFNPDALFPVEVASATADGFIAMDRSEKGRVRMMGDRSLPLSADGALFTISFRGLSSGEPINIVKVEEMEFSAQIQSWDTLNGMVRLSGCDVGWIPGVTKRAHIQSLGPNPAADNVVLTYQAPSGRQPLLTVFNSRGSQVKRLELPEGTGAAQEFRINVADLPPGFYTLELRERNERSWKILLID